MKPLKPIDFFRQSSSKWISDGYNLDIRYFAIKHGLGWMLQGAKLVFSPVRPLVDNTFRIKTDFLLAGNSICSIDAAEAETIINRALAGDVLIDDEILLRLNVVEFGEHVIETPTESGSSALGLMIKTGQRLQWDLTRLEADTMLRRASPPFNGIDDLAHWLDLDLGANALHFIDISIAAPAQLKLPECALTNGKLKVVVEAAFSVDISALTLSCRLLPEGITGRRQLGEMLMWETNPNGNLEGVATIDTGQSWLAHVHLSVGHRHISMHALVDPVRSKLDLPFIVNHFDPNFKHLIDHLKVPKNAYTFENAVSAVLFMLGCTVGHSANTEASDLVALTPAGSLVLIECTMKTSDVATKVGKLIDRRAGLEKALRQQSVDRFGVPSPRPVYAAFVCSTPRDQIAMTAEEFRTRKVIIVSQSDLMMSLQNTPNSPTIDALLTQAVAKFPSEST